jgi:hypothetical protein
MTDQLTNADLSTMNPAQIVEALREGRCHQLLTGKTPDWRYDPSGDTQLGERQLEQMTPSQIVEARKAGRFGDLLAGRSTPTQEKT